MGQDRLLNLLLECDWANDDKLGSVTMVNEVGMGIGSQKLIKSNNMKLIVKLLMQLGGLTIKEISQLTDLSIVTVSKNVEELVESNVLVASGIEAEFSYGRKPMVYQFNAVQKYVASIDLGKKVVDVGIGNMQAEIVEVSAYEIPDNLNGQEIMADIMQRLSDLLGSNGIGLGMLGSIVIANPGIVFDDSGRIKNPAAIAERWADLPLVEMFAKRFGCRVIVMNDIDLSAVGFQAVRRPDERHSNFVHVSVDVGIGAGIIVEGLLLEGQNASAGEVGFTTNIRDDGSIELIHYESVASISALMSRFKELLPENKSSFLYCAMQDDPENLTLEIVERAAQTDAFVQREISHMASYIAAIALNAMMLLDINTVVLGGEVLLLKDKFINPFIQAIRENSIQNSEIDVVTADKQSATFGCFHVGRNAVIENDLC